jgi:antitoxin ParD1/3/4
MLSEKISVSVSHDLVEFINSYRHTHACKNKSQVVQKALKLLQQQELEQYYLAANAEIEPLYDITAADGLEHETW